MRIGHIRPGVLLLAGALLAACSDKPAAPPAQSAPEVGYITLRSQSLTLDQQLPGRTTAYQVAEVRPQVSGVIQKRLFEEGAEVNAGDPLYQIDDRLYRAEVRNAQANLARARATAQSSQLTIQRIEKLATVKAVSEQEHDEARARHQESQAAVASAEAALQSAQINLDYALIRAPISGRTGRSSVTAGALVTANQAQTLTTIRQLDPIYVDLTQSHRQLQQLREAWSSGQLEQVSDDEARVVLALEDGTVYRHAGRMQFSEYAVDESTNSVTLRALFPNPDGDLLPGMFVRARLPEGTRDNTILVPQKALVRDPRGNGFVWVIRADNTLERRAVTAPRAVGSDWLVTEGLSDGERIVVDGMQRAQPEMSVTPTSQDPGNNANTASSPKSGK